jgi:hypothetical protein
MVLAVMVLFLSTLSFAGSSYKNSVWPSQLQNGVLKVRGPGYGSWGQSWVTVSSGVTSYREVGTSKGPVIVYRTGNSWHAVMLRFNTGHKQNGRSFSQPTSIVRGGQYGAILKSGNTCYDYSWNQLKTVPCR